MCITYRGNTDIGSSCEDNTDPTIQLQSLYPYPFRNSLLANNTEELFTATNLFLGGGGSSVHVPSIPERDHFEKPPRQGSLWGKPAARSLPLRTTI